MEYTFRPIDRWPRDLTKKRQRSPFSVTYNKTFALLSHELKSLGVEQAVIQLALSDSEIRRDGQPRAHASPTHPGVIVDFHSKKTGGPVRMPCDAFLGWIDNLRAISLALEALRRIDRYGVTTHAEQYRGWNALPPGTLVTPAPMSPVEAASFVGAVAKMAPVDVLTRGGWPDAYRAAAMKLHPDAIEGRHVPEWDQLQRAAEVIRKHLGL